MSSALLRFVRAHPLVAALFAATLAGTVAAGASQGKLVHALGYVGASVVGVAVIYALTPSPRSVLVRQPAREALVLLSLATVGLAALVAKESVRFGLPPIQGPARMLILAGVLLCVFPVASIAYLRVRGYRFADQGFALRAPWLGLPAAFVVFLAALAFAPESLHTNLASIRSALSAGFLFSVFAQVLAEELLRFQLQTRVGGWLRCPQAGWLVAGVVWGALHVPNSYRGEPAAAGLGVLCILPIGLIWSALTHRTGSIWPAVVAHGLNVWGLQNL